MSARVLFRCTWILVLLLAACVPASRLPQAPEVLPSPSGDWTLRFVQAGGFAGVKLILQISSDGRLTAENQRAGRSVSQTLAPETVAQIASQVAPVLQGTSGGQRSGCADCFLYHLEFTSEGQTTLLDLDDTTLQDSGAAELVRLLQQLRDRALGANP